MKANLPLVGEMGGSPEGVIEPQSSLAFAFKPRQ